MLGCFLRWAWCLGRPRQRAAVQVRPAKQRRGRFVVRRTVPPAWHRTGAQGYPCAPAGKRSPYGWRPAASGGCVGMMLWVRTAAVPTAPLRSPTPTARLAWLSCQEALARGDLATAAHLVGMGVVWGCTALAQGATEGCFFSALQWMMQRGVPAGPQEVRQALKVAKRPEVREWLVSLLPQGPVREEAVRVLLLTQGEAAEHEEHVLGGRADWDL